MVWHARIEEVDLILCSFNLEAHGTGTRNSWHRASNWWHCRIVQRRVPEETWCCYKCLRFTWSCCVVYWWNVSWHCNFEKSCLFSCHADITNVLLMILMFNIYYSDHPGQGSQAEDIFRKWASIPWPPTWTVCDATQASTRDAPSCKACIDKGPEKRAGKQSQGGRRC